MAGLRAAVSGGRCAAAARDLSCIFIPPISNLSFGGLIVKENHRPWGQQNSVLRALPFWLCVLVVALTLPLASRAQDTGYISGTVTDKSGAAVAGAEVVITNAGGSLTRTTTSNTDGAYVVSG